MLSRDPLGVHGVSVLDTSCGPVKRQESSLVLASLRLVDRRTAESLGLCHYIAEFEEVHDAYLR